MTGSTAKKLCLTYIKQYENYVDVYIYIYIEYILYIVAG